MSNAQNLNNTSDNANVEGVMQKTTVKAQTIKIIGIGLNDADMVRSVFMTMRPDHDVVVEIMDDMLDDELRIKDIAIELLFELLRSDNTFVVVGKEVLGSYGDNQTLKELAEEFRGGSNGAISHRILLESGILLNSRLKDVMPEFETADDLEDVLQALDGVEAVEEDEENPNKKILIPVEGAKHTFEITDDGKVLVDGTMWKPALLGYGATTQNHALPYMPVGIKSPKELLQLAIGCIIIAQQDGRQKIQYALGVLTGFSGAQGVTEADLEQYDEAGLKVYHENRIGSVTLRMRDDESEGYIYATPAGVDFVELAALQREYDETHWTVPNNMGAELIRMDFESMKNGSNIFGVTVDDNGMVTMPCNGMKHVTKSHAKHAGVAKLLAVLLPNDPLSMAGIATMSRKMMNKKFVARRKTKIGGAVEFRKPYEIKKFIRVYQNSEILVNEGDKVYEGSEILMYDGRVRTLRTNGASFGIVTKVHRTEYELEDSGKIVMEMVVEVQLYDIGEAKIRDVGKANIVADEDHGGQTFIKEGADWVYWPHLSIGQGVIKNTLHWNKNSKFVREVEAKRVTKLDPELYAMRKAQYGADARFQWNDAEYLMITVQKAVVVEITAKIERTTIQENISDAGMTLYQLLYVSGVSAGNKWALANIMPEARKKVGTLIYLLLAANSIVLPGLPVFKLGIDELDIDPSLNDEELLAEFGLRYPSGVILEASDKNGTARVWFHGGYIRHISAPDSMGAGLTGIGEVAARIVGLMAMPGIAALPTFNMRGLVIKYINGCRRMSKADSLNKVFKVDFGASAKVALSARVPQDEVWLDPRGPLAKKVAKTHGVPVRHLNGRYSYYLRHPMIVGEVLRIRLVKGITKHQMLINEEMQRRVTQGDGDGDNGNLFPIKSKKLAIKMKKQLDRRLPNADMNMSVLGLPADTPHLKLYGEFLDEKTVEQMQNKSETKHIKAWEDEFAGAARAATWWTGTSYRILEFGGILEAMGLGSLRAMLLGAWCYEHRGLANKKLKETSEKALNSWIKTIKKAEQADDMVLAFGKMLKDENPGYAAQGHALDGISLKLTSELNKLVKKGSIPNGHRGLIGDFPYTDLYDMIALAWRLGRGHLSFSLKHAAAVATRDEDGNLLMDGVADAWGFRGSFFYQLLRMISVGLGVVADELGVTAPDFDADDSLIVINDD